MDFLLMTLKKRNVSVILLNIRWLVLPILILREILLDYNNSLTIFIRGHPKITERVKEEDGVLQIPLQEQVGVKNQKIT